jgi:putative ABC transport system ATP-binding protein
VALDHRIQDQIVRTVLADIQNSDHKPAIIWVLSNVGLAEQFERILVFQGGSLAESGTSSELLQHDGMFKELLSL